MAKSGRWPVLTKPREVNCDHRPASLLVLPSVFGWRGYLHILPDLMLEGQKGCKTQVVERVHLTQVSFSLVWHLGLSCSSQSSLDCVSAGHRQSVIFQRCTFWACPGAFSTRQKRTLPCKISEQSLKACSNLLYEKLFTLTWSRWSISLLFLEEQKCGAENFQGFSPGQTAKMEKFSPNNFS